MPNTQYLMLNELFTVHCLWKRLAVNPVTSHLSYKPNLTTEIVMRVQHLLDKRNSFGM